MTHLDSFSVKYVNLSSRERSYFIRGDRQVAEKKSVKKTLLNYLSGSRTAVSSLLIKS